MDETGMSDADKRAFVEDVLLTWGEEAARGFAERYRIDFDALKRERETSVEHETPRTPAYRSH